MEQLAVGSDFADEQAEEKRGGLRVATVPGKPYTTASDGLQPAVQAIDQWGGCSVAPGVPRAHFC